MAGTGLSNCGPAIGLACDITNRESVPQMFGDVMLAYGGVLVVGANVLEAFDRLEVLESTSEALVNSRLIGEVAPMSEEVIDDLKRAFASMLA